MTHDELLARIAVLSVTPETNVVPAELATALMAVMELHKQANENGYCEICPDFDYPCETIQAIEKHLK